MELRALRYFVYVTELKSFSKAATTLHIAQPAISRQVQKLEEEVGTKLLVRTRLGMELTDAGVHLYNRAKHILDEVGKTKSEVSAYASEPAGDFLLAVSPAAGQLLVPPLIEATRTQFPKLNVRVIEGFTAHVHEGLLSGKFDLGVLHDPSDDRNLKGDVLLHEPLYLVTPVGYFPENSSVAVANGDHARVAVNELERMPLILPSHPNQLRSLIDGVAARRKLSLDVILEVDSIPITKSLVQRGLGCALLSYGSVSDDVARNLLEVRSLHSPDITRRLVVVQNKEHRPTNAIREVKELIRKVAQQLVVTGAWRGSF